ncbi:hypothetical protein JVU11DRAFT_9512 [Chiua virens]|nr:hypothetical protein JVU11DRAFT_9512 [Chiua virens]
MASPVVTEVPSSSDTPFQLLSLLWTVFPLSIKQKASKNRKIEKSKKIPLSFCLSSMVHASLQKKMLKKIRKSNKK